jgi:hypothetical protein
MAMRRNQAASKMSVWTLAAAGISPHLACLLKAQTPPPSKAGGRSTLPSQAERG